MKRVYTIEENGCKKIIIKKKTILMILLIVLVIIISSMQGWAFARMQNEIKESEQVFIGEFIFIANSEMQQNEFELKSNCKVEYLFEIKNYENEYITDVSMEYNLQMVFPSAVPSMLTFKIINEDGTEFFPEKRDDVTYIFENLGVVNPGLAVNKKYKLVFETENVNENIDIENIQIKVLASQSAPY